jgi:hypothetical protein
LEDSFCFPRGIRSYSFCRALDSASFEKKVKILSFPQAEIHAKQKGSPNIFYYVQYGDKQYCHAGFSFLV